MAPMTRSITPKVFYDKFDLMLTKIKHHYIYKKKVFYSMKEITLNVKIYKDDQTGDWYCISEVSNDPKLQAFGIGSTKESAIKHWASCISNSKCSYWN